MIHKHKNIEQRRIISKKIFLIISVFVLMCFQFDLYAQLSKSISFRNFSVDEGFILDNQSVLHRDSMGYFWIGGNQLQRFDGYEFKVFPSNPDDTITWKNSILSMQSDTAGNFWLGSYGGVNRYIAEKDYFRYYSQYTGFDGEQQGLPDILHMFVDKQGTFWLVSDQLFQFVPDEDRFIAHPLPLPMGVENPGEILGTISRAEYHFSRNEIYFGLDGVGIMVYSFESHTSRILCASDFYPGTQPAFNDVFVDSKGNVWFATSANGAFYFNPGSQNFGLFPPDQQLSDQNLTVNYFDVRSISELNNGRVLIGTDSRGINVYDYVTNTFQYVRSNFKDEHSLITDGAHRLYKDDEGLLWVRCFDGGIGYFNPAWKNFFHVQRTGKYKQEISSSIISSISAFSDTTSFVGTDNGLNQWNTKKNIFTQIPLLKNTTPQITSLSKSREGKLWIGTNGNGVFVFDPVDDVSEQIGKFETAEFASKHISAVHAHSSGKIWIAVNSPDDYRLIVYDPFNGEIKNLSNAAANDGISINHPLSARISVISEDSQSNTWIGYENGGIDRVVSRDENTYEFYHFNTTEKINSDATVHCFYEDLENEKMFVGTADGLLSFTYASGDFVSVGIKSDRSVQALSKDRHGNFWLATTQGLIRYTSDFSSHYTFDAQDGIQGPVFLPNAFAESEQGIFFFGGTNGITYFVPDSIHINTKMAPVYITDIRINNNSIHYLDSNRLITKDVRFVDSLVLTYSQSSVGFSFTGIGYTYPEQFRYRYQMEGLQKNWVDLGTQREVSFANIPPGKYTFRVQVANSDGLWNPIPIAVFVRIIPPWWRAWWFYSILFLVGLASIVTFLKVREREVKRVQEKLKNQLNQGKSEIEEQKSLVRDLQYRLEEKNKNEFVLRWQNKGIVSFGEIISTSKNSLKKLLSAFARQVDEYLDVDRTAIYLKETNEKDNTHELVLMACSVSDVSENNRSVLMEGEGLVGACFTDREVLQVDEVPETFFLPLNEQQTINPEHKKYSGHLTLVPLLLDEYLEGVLEVYSNKKLDAYKVEFLQSISRELTAAITALNTTKNIERVLEKNKKLQRSLKKEEKDLVRNLEQIKIEHEEAEKQETTLNNRIKREEKKHQELLETINRIQSKE